MVADSSNRSWQRKDSVGGVAAEPMMKCKEGGRDDIFSECAISASCFCKFRSAMVLLLYTEGMMISEVSVLRTLPPR